MVLWYRPLGAAPAGAPGRPSPRPRFPRGVTRRRLVMLFVILAMTDFLSVAWGFLMPEFAAQKDLPAWLVHGGAMLVFTFGLMVMMVPAGMLADRMGREKLIVGTLSVSLACYAALVVLPPGSPVATIALLFLLGGMSGVANPLGVAYGQELVPGNRGAVTGVLMGWAWAVGGTAPLAAGALARNPALGATGALAWLALGNVLALVLAIGLHRHRD